MGLNYRYEPTFKIKSKVKKLQNKALQKTMFEKKQDPAEQLHKELRILKCSDMVIHKITYSCLRQKLIKNLQNHLFD